MNSRPPPPKPNTRMHRPRVSSLTVNTQDSTSAEESPLSATAPKPGGVSSLAQAFEAKMTPNSNHFLHISESRSRSNSSPVRPQISSIATNKVEVTSPRRGSIQENSEVDETPLAYSEIKARFQQAANNNKIAPNPRTSVQHLQSGPKRPSIVTEKTMEDTQHKISITGMDVSKESEEDITTERNPFLGSDEETYDSSENSQSDSEESISTSTNKLPENISRITKTFVPPIPTIKRRPPVPPPLRRLGSNDTGQPATVSHSDNLSVANHVSTPLSRTSSSNGSSSPSIASPRINRPRGYTHGDAGRVNPGENVLRNLDQILRNRTTSFSESNPDISINNVSPIYKPSPPLPGRPRSYSSESLSTRPSIDSSMNDQEHKNAEKKAKVIQELVDTEISYLKDLHILDQIYFQQAQKSEVFHSRDIKTLFCNLPQVIEFTQEFSELLKVASSGPSNESEKPSKWIGEAFSLMMGSLETVYCNYCKAHESAVIRLNELQSNQGANDFFEKCKEEMKGQTTSWDFGSLLIKPVQRVLKYPLLLQQILVLTPESDPDFSHLRSANQDIQKVAERINEIKKRKDIVETIVGIKKKEVVLSHGINKRITRRTQQFKQAAGLQDATTDVLFDHFLAKFEHQQCEAKNLVAQVESWKCRVQEYLDMQMKFSEMIERMYANDSFGDQSKRGLESQAKEYRLSMTKIYMEAQRRLDSSIKSLIIPQVEEFLSLFQKPQTVIRKREKKLLDYDRARGIKLRGDKPDAALEKSANDYIAINAQLQDELPKFFGLTTQFYNILVQVIASIQAKFYQGLVQELEHVHQFLTPNDSENDDLKNIIQDYHQSLEHEGGFHHQLDEIHLLKKDGNYSPSRTSLDSSSITSVSLGRTLSLQSAYSTELEAANNSEYPSLGSHSVRSRKDYPSLSAKSNVNRVQQPMARSVSNGNPPLNFQPPVRQVFDDPFMTLEEASSWGPSVLPDYATNAAQSPPLPRRTTTKVFKCTAIYPFQAEHPDEMNLPLGSVLMVSKTEGEDSGAMWYGEDMDSGRTGWFPASHCTLLE